MDNLTGVNSSDNGRQPDDLLDDAPDPTDLDAILDGDDEGDLLAEGAEDVQSDAVGLGRPKRSDWIRTHPDPSHCRPLTLLENPKRKWSFFGVAADLQGLEELDGELATFTAITTVTLNGDMLLWILRRGGGFGGENLWVESAKEAARQARTAWVRVKAGTDRYKKVVARGKLSEPDFRGWSFQDVLTRALKGRMITTVDHSVLRMLRGETEGAGHDA
jgi:hypothetical protein